MSTRMEESALHGLSNLEDLSIAGNTTEDIRASHDAERSRVATAAARYEFHGWLACAEDLLPLEPA